MQVERDDSTVVEGVEIARVVFQHTREVVVCALHVEVFEAQQRAVVRRRRVVRVQLERIVVVSQRPGIAVDVVAQPRTVHVHVRVLRVEAYHLVHVRHGLFPLLALDVHVRPHQVIVYLRV